MVEKSIVSLSRSDMALLEVGEYFRNGQGLFREDILQIFESHGLARSTAVSSIGALSRGYLKTLTGLEGTSVTVRLGGRVRKVYFRADQPFEEIQNSLS